MRTLVLAFGLSAAAAGAWSADCDVAAGGRIFANKCGICHAAEAGAAHTVGPNLHAVVGRPAGKAPGFAYSEALAAANVDWDAGRLDAFIKSPQQAIPGTAMPFQGLKSEGDRRHLLCFLTSLQ